MRCSSILPIYILASNNFKNTLKSWIKKIGTYLTQRFTDGNDKMRSFLSNILLFILSDLSPGEESVDKDGEAVDA